MDISKKQLRKMIRENPKLAKSVSREVSKLNAGSSKSAAAPKSGGLFGGLLKGLGGLGGGLNLGSISSKVSATNQFLQELNSAITTADHLRTHLGPLMAKKDEQPAQSAQESTTSSSLPKYKRGAKPPRLM